MSNFASRSMVLLGILALAVGAVASPKVLSVPFQSRKTIGKVSKHVEPFPEVLNNYMPFGEYFATVTVGTPAQSVELLIDTSSSDIWIYRTGGCHGDVCAVGEYESSNSSTYHLVKEGVFKIRYGDGSLAKGDYITDSFGIGDVTILNLTMAAATLGKNNPTGVLGIGLNSNEAGIIYEDFPGYQNLPDLLLKQGLTSTKSYSLYLDDLASGSGQVLFGGYDQNKFTGDLIMLPLQRTSSKSRITEFAIAWTSLSLTTENGTTVLETSDLPTTAVLDSGTELTYIPRSLVESFVDLLPLKPQLIWDTYFVDCDLHDIPGQINFGFGGINGPVIAVPFAELAVPRFYLNGTIIKFHDGKDACALGVQSTSDPIYYFGQSILRSAYVMYDLTNMLVGLAPVIFDSETPDVVEYGDAKSGNGLTTDRSLFTVTQDWSKTADALVTYSTISTQTSLRSYPCGPYPTREPASLSGDGGGVGIPAPCVPSSTQKSVAGKTQATGLSDGGAATIPSARAFVA